MIFGIAALLVKVFNLDFEKAKRIARFMLIACALAVVLVAVVIFGQIQSCRTAKQEKRIEDVKTNVTTGKVEANVQGNVVNQAANVSNQALQNVNVVKNANLKTFDNSYDKARERFCREVGC